MILSELLDKIHFIKAQSFEEFLLRRAEETLSQHALEEVLQNNRTLIPKLFSQIFSLLMIYGTILIGGILVIREGMSLGVVTACTMLARRAISPFQNISQFFLRLSQINANIRIQKEIHLKDSPDEPLPDIDWEGFLEFRDVSVPSEIPENKALDFSFMAFKGSIIVIDAAGTEWEENLLELLLGYQKPGKGRIILDNLIISHYNSDYLSDQYILLPRSVKLFRGSILQNITRFNPSLNSQGLDAATLMGLDPLIAKLPRGYETQIRGKHDPLSLPVLQRISLARAFLTRPRILIAHHCDDSMDSSTLSVFTELLRNNRNSCSAIVFSQNPEVQALADEIISINQDGEVTHIHPQREASHG